ncbi:MAG: asparagine synthase (glutamine-hydrolyzing) [Nanoarchaeota archaeon]
MCGITGFNWEDAKLVKKMADCISYRGPDQEGYFVNGVSLGHKRLSIIDLSYQGRQPMFNEDGSICVVFNGEIYNFQELKPELEKKGHIFRSHTDTEVIIHAYEEYGVDCLHKFNGMFAFALWDSNKNELFIARDRLGIKPLYYHYKKGKLIFASEIKAILETGVKREVNEDCLKQIIYYEYPIDGSTLVKNIVELKPAHYLLLKDKKLEIKPYWSLNVKETNYSKEFYVKRLKELLTESVKRMLVADVPIGLSLSGGIDSSVIVALASTLSNEPIKTFTLGFDVPDDEFQAAQVVAEYYRTDHTEIHVDSNDYMNALLKVLWHYERPFSKPAIIPVYYLINKIRRQLTVSLSGEGADELFAGYRRYDAYSAPPKSRGDLTEEQYDEINKKVAMSFEEKVRYVSSSAFGPNKEEFFTSEFLKLPPHLDVMNTFGPFIKGVPSDGSQLNKALKYELETEIPYFHCKKLDAMSMANSHEVRVPYLDHTVVEFAMTIPAKYKFLGGERKIILRELAKEILPEQVVNRKKQPMVTPLSNYFKEGLVELSEKILTVDALKKRGYYNVERVKKLINDVKENRIPKEQTESSRGNPFRQLLLITTIELWIRMFIEKRPIDLLRKDI